MKIGKEEVAVFHLMQKALLHDSLPCFSAFARHTVPGCIFVEANTSQQLIAATSGIPELIPTKIRLVPDDKMLEVLSMAPSPRPKAQGWVRLLGNTKKLCPYKGDLALVVDVSKTSLLQLWLIPRIQYNNDEAVHSQSSPQLFNAEGARSSLGDKYVRKGIPSFFGRMNSALRDTLSSRDKNCSSAKLARHFRPRRSWPRSKVARLCCPPLWLRVTDGLNQQKWRLMIASRF